MIKKENKQGSIIDIFFILVTIFGLAIFLLIAAYVFPKVTAQLREGGLNNTAQGRNALTTTENIVNKFDYIFLIIFVGLNMGVLISAFLIDSHPIFIPIYIFLLLFAVIISVVFSNVYQTFSIESALNETAAEQNYIQTIIIDKLLYYTIGIGILSMIIIFAKSGQGRI